MLVYDALRLRNTIQIIGICICNIGLLIYGAVQIDQIQDAVGVLLVNDAIDTDVWSATKPILIAIPCILGLSSSLMIFVSWKLYDEFAWTIYKHISADLRMKRRYLTYQVGDGLSTLAVSALTHLPDLYRAAQVRLLLLPGLYSPIRCHRHRPHGHRICTDLGRHSRYHHHPLFRSLFHAERKHFRHDCHYCKFPEPQSVPSN